MVRVAITTSAVLACTAPELLLLMGMTGAYACALWVIISEKTR